MKNERLLSIVIPTKNRYEYLKILIEALLANESKEFELIIQDNSDDNSKFGEYIQSIEDDRLKYNHTSGWLSVIDNCDLGVSGATGSFVCMLGDDDGILINQSLELVRWLLSNNIHGATVNKISYGWPDISHAVWGDAYSGNINFKPFNNNIIKFNSQIELDKLCRKAAAFGLGNLARTYHGFISLEKLQALKNETGSFFPGPSPDMANAVGLTKYIEHYVYADFPTVISGHCKKSTGGQGGMKEHHGKIENIGHLPVDTAQRWSTDIPFFWSGPTIYSESARRALEETNRADIKLNYIALYACCLIYEKNYKKEVFRVMFSNKKILKKLKISIQVGGYGLRIFIRRLYYLFKNVYKNKVKNKMTDIKANDINEVIQFFEQKYVLIEADSIKFK